ncbi:hypothetical protein N7454_010780 [Penicillium verhagenii]|nr:hypothetical protein N7454_010780 [Penicillium verhagenii]
MSISRLALAAFLLGHASAGNIQSSAPVSSQAHVHTAVCHTVIGLTSVASVPTTTITRRIHDPTPVVVFSTVQDTVTVTPSVSTLTETDYETTTITSTASTITDVFSSTSTEYDTATLTVTPNDVTSTVSETVSVTITSTATIGTSAGFSPIADTFTSLAYNAQKRSLDLELDLESDCGPQIDDYKYAQEVICHEKIIIKTTTISTVTEAPASATAATPSTTVTETNTITTSSVVVPDDVSTTLSYSTTSTITETSTAPAVTDTVTSTATVVAAITTTSAYAACATNNVAGSPLSSEFGLMEGDYITYLSWGTVPGYGTSVLTSVASGEACCISCMELDDCAFSFYSPSYKYCYRITTTTCSASTVYGTGGVSASSSISYEVSNGPCGFVKKN